MNVDANGIGIGMGRQFNFSDVKPQHLHVLLVVVRGRPYWQYAVCQVNFSNAHKTVQEDTR